MDKWDVEEMFDKLGLAGYYVYEAERYIVIDCKNGDEFCKGFEDEDAALEYALKSWEALSIEEQRDRESFFVLKSKNEDVDSADHFDGDVLIKYSAMTIKTFLNNWEIFIGGDCITFDTGADYINSDLYDDEVEVVEWVKELIEREGYAVTDDMLNQIEVEVHIDLGDRFEEE